MNNQIAVITGATGGIGTVVCKYLIANGYTVYAACRNEKKGEALRKEIFGEDAVNAPDSNPNDSIGKLVFVPLDLKSFESVRGFCNAVIEKVSASGNHISLLINNAGFISPYYEITQDGYESTMQVNYLSGRMITEKLLPYIKGKIINTVSCTISSGIYNKPEKEPITEKKRINTLKSLKIYSNSKLMLALYTIGLHKRLEKGIECKDINSSSLKTLNDIQIYGADPGIVNTGIISMHRWYDFLADMLFRPFIKTSEQGAQPIINAIKHTAQAIDAVYDNAHTPADAIDAAGSNIQAPANNTTTTINGPALFIGCKIKSFPRKLFKPGTFY